MFILLETHEFKVKHKLNVIFEHKFKSIKTWLGEFFQQSCKLVILKPTLKLGVSSCSPFLDDHLSLNLPAILQRKLLIQCIAYYKNIVNSSSKLLKL